MSAPDGLFAAKGQAQPVDQTREATDLSDEREAITSAAVDTAAAPLPDLFGEPANDESTPPSQDTDDNAVTAGYAEPPPAASLLTIVSQQSAARRRPARPENPNTTSPEAFKDTGDDDAETKPNITATEDTVLKTANLPVPVQIQLPMVIDNPVADKHKWDRRMAALAACIAISIAGAATFLIAGSADNTASTVRNETPSITADAAPEPEVAEQADTDAEETAPPQSAVGPKPPITKITSVRIDANGRAIMSGQAPPAAELIVLHNRQPLGTARSNTAGIWTFSARVPTRTTQNEISVVPMQIDNSVMVTDLPAVPRPGRRPAIPSYYFAQIASLPSAADAGREAAKLGTKLASIVATHRISVRVATIENGRKVYRVAIGGFSTKASAADICSRIRARNTSCLVMRGS